jgi:hypothetical protein
MSASVLCGEGFGSSSVRAGDKSDRGARTAGAAERLEAVLRAYAHAAFRRRSHDNDITALHYGEHVAAAHRHLREFVQELISDAATAGATRRDMPADELTTYCLHALTAAATARSTAAADRLVTLILAGLRPPNQATPTS